jgi:branched-chain amino acid transport system substrate-binding protein
MSGVYKEPAAMIHKGYRLWAQQVNARGGLLGRKLALVIHDDQSQPERVRRLYRQLIEEEKVDLLLSPYSSPLTMAAAEISEAHNYVMIACGSAAEAVWQRGQRYLFGIYATASRYFIGLLDLMAREGYRSVALLYEESAFHRAVALSVEDWARRFRLQVPLQRGFQRGHDLEALTKALLDLPAPVDAVIVSAYPPDSYRLLTLFQAADCRPPVLGMSIAPTYPDFHQRAGAISEGVFGPSQWEPDERIPFPGTRDFIEAFESAFGHLPSYHAGSAFAAGEILARAVTRVGGLDQKALREFIAGLDTVTVIGRFKVDAQGMQIGHSPILIQWQEGSKEIVYPPKMQTARPILR